MLTLFTTTITLFGSDGDLNLGAAFTTSRTHYLFCRNQTKRPRTRDGYSCYPELPYHNTFNNAGYNNYSECLVVVLPPSKDAVKVFSSQPGSYDYYPYGFDKARYLIDLKINSGDG